MLHLQQNYTYPRYGGFTTCCNDMRFRRGGHCFMRPGPNTPALSVTLLTHVPLSPLLSHLVTEARHLRLTKEREKNAQNTHTHTHTHTTKPAHRHTHKTHTHTHTQSTKHTHTHTHTQQNLHRQTAQTTHTHKPTQNTPT